MNHADLIAKTLNIKTKNVQAVIDLLDDDNTVPFIARYRKEATGNMDEEYIREISSQIEKLRTLDKRKEAVLAAIREQEKLTPALEKQILAAETLTMVEDLYQPYKKKRKTKADVAKENGLQRLAESIIRQGLTGKTPHEMAQAYLNDKVPDEEAALAGARDIVAEWISNHAGIRSTVREKALQWGIVKCEKTSSAEDNNKVYEDYYDFSYNASRIKAHQVLAINRAEKEKVLRVKVEVDERDWFNPISRVFRPDRESPLYEQLNLSIQDAAQRLLLPAIERDVRRELTEKAEAQAITVFASNLKALLNQPPLLNRIVMGIDPGFRTGCKAAVIDATGKVLDTATIYPHEPQKQEKESLQTLEKMCKQHNVNLIAIGNGTASRETEQLVAKLIQQMKNGHYLIASEAGASVYSASKLAKEELPGMDVSMRGAVSIARRVQDPLSELVKIDPKSIGVGMYQHDVNEKELESSLAGVVESVVNSVGVDINIASPALLTHVAGIGPRLAQRIVAHRDKNGVFKSREELTDISGMGSKAFEQSAGFLRIRNGSNQLDASAIHPESYQVAEKILSDINIGMNSPVDKKTQTLEALQRSMPLEKLADKYGTDPHTLEDIFEQFIRPGRDPRADLPLPVLRSDVLKMEDLQPGMQLKGTVRNVVDFGAFVDIGVKQDGLLHKSKMSSDNPVKVGDVITVTVINIDMERNRIALSL